MVTIRPKTALMPGKDRIMNIREVPCSASGAQPSESSVPIIDVHSENFQSIWPSILLAMKNSSFIALDTELSGLGDRRSLMASSIEDRYKAVSIAARSRSILSLGLSCFKLKQKQPCSPISARKESEGQQEKCSAWNYMVQTFNITVLCQDDYTVEPRSMQFLVDHGFDFNKQYSKGILYQRGNDKNHSETNHPSVRDLFSELLNANVPVVFHNAIMDLIFLHQNLYCDLPFKLNSFLCNLSEMFTAGIYDTKFLIEYYMRMPASYLEYVFKKCFRKAMKSVSKNHLLLSFLDYPQSFAYVKYHDLGCHTFSTSLTYQQLQVLVCQRFADHGYCHKGRSCPKSHNMELVLDLDESRPSKTQRKKDRKRKREEEQKTSKVEEKAKTCRTANNETGDIPADLSEHNEENTDQSPEIQKESCSVVSSCEDDDNGSKDSILANDDIESETVTISESVKMLSGVSEMGVQQNMSRSINAGHTAGFDAFMTGYIFATAIAEIGGAQVKDEVKITGGQLSVWRNKIYLTGKEVPLSVAKSNFASVSNFHKEKHKRLQEQKKNIIS